MCRNVVSHGLQVDFSECKHDMRQNYFERKIIISCWNKEPSTVDLGGGLDSNIQIK